MAGFLYGIYTIIKKLFFNPPGLVTGFSALMSVLVFMGGMLMLMLGLVGEYMGRMYVAMNNSPQYVIRQTTFREEPAGKDGGMIRNTEKIRSGNTEEIQSGES